MDTLSADSPLDQRESNSTSDCDDSESASASIGILFTCQWGKQICNFCVPLGVGDASVADLRNTLYQLTHVHPDRQKIIGLKMGKTATMPRALTDDTLLTELLLPEGCIVPLETAYLDGILTERQSKLRKLEVSTPEIKPHASLNDRVKVKFVLVGAADSDVVFEEKISDIPDLVDDFDFDYYPSTDDVAKDVSNRRKLTRRIERITINVMNELRPEKRLLVLDLDYTLLDYKNPSLAVEQRKRPYLEQFLSSVFPYYNLVVWSQTSWRWIEIKLTEMGMLTSPLYNISFIVDKTAMFSVTNREQKEVRVHEVKSLEFIWSKFPQVTGPHNTIHVDDLGRNFAMNPANGLQCRAYRCNAIGASMDQELRAIAYYLVLLATHPDVKDKPVTSLPLKDWRTHLMKLADGMPGPF